MKKIIVRDRAYLEGKMGLKMYIELQRQGDSWTEGALITLFVFREVIHLIY